MNFFFKINLIQISDSESDQRQQPSAVLLSIFSPRSNTSNPVHDPRDLFEKGGETLLARQPVFWENPRRFWKVWFRNDNENGREEGKEWAIELPEHVPSAKPQVCPGLCAWNAAAA